MFAQIVADELGVPVDQVPVTTGDTRRFKYGVGTFASRAAVMSGNAVRPGGPKVRERRCGSPVTRSRSTLVTSRSSTVW